jgi:hypothetical protein
MHTKSKIALSFAVVLGATSVSLTTQALAQNPYPDRGRYEPGFKNGTPAAPSGPIASG